MNRSIVRMLRVSVFSFYEVVFLQSLQCLFSNVLPYAIVTNNKNSSSYYLYQTTSQPDHLDYVPSSGSGQVRSLCYVLTQVYFCSVYFGGRRYALKRTAGRGDTSKCDDRVDCYLHGYLTKARTTPYPIPMRALSWTRRSLPWNECLKRSPGVHRQGELFNELVKEM